MYGFIGSDHRPLSISVTGILCNNVAANDDNNIAIDCTVPEWAKVDDVVSDKYSSTLNDLLQNVLPPYDALACCTGHTAKCTDCSHRCAIDQYYGDVISCIKQCVDLAVPKKATKSSQFNVPGWCDIVQEKYDASRAAFLEWVSYGRPRNGAVFEHMSRCRARFKLALQFCRQHEEQLNSGNYPG